MINWNPDSPANFFFCEFTIFGYFFWANPKFHWGLGGISFGMRKNLLTTTVVLAYFLTKMMTRL